MELPKAHEYIMFDKGGICLTKAPSNQAIYLGFFSEHHRLINETTIQSYLLQGGNLRDINEMIGSAWAFACERCSPKQLSRPDDQHIKDAVRAMQELLGLKVADKNA